jgi:hypothetical protein
MYCAICIKIPFEEILSGKLYQHLTLGELQQSAINDCPLCIFLLRHISPALRRSLGPDEILQIYLEQHSSKYRFTQHVTAANSDEVKRQDAEDDAFRDAMIGVQAGYTNTLIAVVGRPKLHPPEGSNVEEREVCYVTLEFCSESGPPSSHSTPKSR